MRAPLARGIRADMRCARTPLVLAATALSAGAACSSSLVGPSFERFDPTATPNPSDYPDVPGVVLLDRGTWWFTVDPDTALPVARLRRYRRVKVLREAGRALARIDLPYEPGTQIADLVARSVQPDGSTAYVDGGDAIDIDHPSGVKAKLIGVPGVGVGTIVEVAYDHYFQDLRFLPAWRFQDRLPTVRSEVALVVPKGYSIDYRFMEAGETLDKPPERFDVERGTRLFWSMTGLPALFPELAQPDPQMVGPQLRLAWTAATVGGQRYVGFDGWEAARAWFFEIAKDWTRLDAAQVDEARRVVGDVPDEEKARKLMEIIARDLKWEPGVPLPVFLTWFPSANTTLQNKTGNVTSRGLVLTSLLRAVGLDAYPAVVAYRDQGRLYPDFADVRALDAVVTVIPRASGPLVLDPNQLTVSAAVASPRLQGARIVMMRDDLAEVIQVPVSAPAESETRVRYDLTVDRAGTITGSLEARLTGAEAGTLRDRLLDADPARYPEILSEFLGLRGAALPIESASIADLAALRRPLTVRGNLRVPGAWTGGDGPSTSIALGRIVGRVGPRLAQVRRLPWEFGPPHRSEVVATVMFPEDHEPQPPPPAFSSRWTHGETTIEVRAETSRRLGIRRSDEVRVLSIDPIGYRDFRRHHTTVEEAERSELGVERPPPRELEY
jgi:hypothetical protein